MTKLERIADLIKRRGADAMIITSRSSILYATGSNSEGVLFITAAGHGTCFTDSRYTEMLQIATKDTAWEVKELLDRNYAGALKDITAVHGVKTLAYEGNTILHRDYAAYAASTGCEMVSFDDGLSELRNFKDAEEVSRITKAQRIAEHAFEDILGFIRPGVTDFEIQARLKYTMGLKGDEGGFYGVLVGNISSMPHGHACGKIVQPGDLVMMDYGARFGGYVSDMTRTVAVGDASDEIRAAYEAVKKAQDYAFAAMNVGALGKDIHRAATLPIIESGFGEYVFTHGLGHGIGLDVHEDPRASAASEHVFAEGMVCTNEPGIYVPGRYGIRIEDMVWLSPEGKVNLTRANRELIILK